jgi:hypothetical protein
VSRSTDGRPANFLRATISEPYDPPAYGPADDRVPRTQSQVKDFKPMNLGTISMDAGRGELSLRATEIPGESVAEIRYVALTKK